MSVLDEAGERLGTMWGTADVEGPGEARETGEDGDAYEPVTKRVTKWMM